VKYNGLGEIQLPALHDVWFSLPYIQPQILSCPVTELNKLMFQVVWMFSIILKQAAFLGNIMLSADTGANDEDAAATHSKLHQLIYLPS
jgi:hypothetical protein